MAVDAGLPHGVGDSDAHDLFAVARFGARKDLLGIGDQKIHGLLLEIVELPVLENREGIVAVEIDVGVFIGKRGAEVMQQGGRERDRFRIGLMVEGRLEGAVSHELPHHILGVIAADGLKLRGELFARQRGIVDAMLDTIRGTDSQISPTATMMVSGTGRISRLARLLLPPEDKKEAEFSDEMFFLNIVASAMGQVAQCGGFA